MKMLMTLAVAASFGVAVTGAHAAGAAFGGANATGGTDGTPDILLRQTRSVPMLGTGWHDGYNAYAWAPLYQHRHKTKHHR